VVHFDNRLTLAGEQLNAERVDSRNSRSVGTLTVPGIRLTRYEYNAAEKFIEVEGEAESFKYVAQQIISFKSENLFAGIAVQSLDRTRKAASHFLSGRNSIDF